MAGDIIHEKRASSGGLPHARVEASKMRDAVQFEGPFARFTLRAWGGEVGDADARPERVRYHDEDEALTMLRGAVDPDALRGLRAFLFELGADPASLANDPLNLLCVVARRIVSGELVLEREPLAVMSSHTVEPVEAQIFEAPVNEIHEGVGLHARALVEAEHAAKQETLSCQAKQAQTLQVAAATAVPFCEVCAGSHAPALVGDGPAPDLATQAKQAQTLEDASAAAVPFCEVCANCRGPQVPHESQVDPPRVSEPPPKTGLTSQASQAQTLAAASAKGTPFCEECNC